jgi:CBS domain-containing protein
MKVRDAMADTVRTASPGDAVVDAARAMPEEGAGFLPVVDEDRLVGVVTDRDIVVRCIADGTAGPDEASVAEIMSTDVHTIGPDEDLEAAADRMADGEIRRLPVVEDAGRLVGVLSHGNLVQATRGGGPAREATTGVTRGA